MENKGDKKTKWVYLIAVGLLLVIAFFYFGGKFQQQPKEKKQEATNLKPSQEKPVEQPSVSFKDASGNIIPVDQLKGKVVFINFWATWCPPCKAEMPSIQTLYNKFKDNNNVLFLLVEIEGDIEGANKFLQQEELSLPIVYPNSAIPQEWLDGAIPTTVILDKKGNLATREEGMRDYSEKSVADFIQNLINQS